MTVPKKATVLKDLTEMARVTEIAIVGLTWGFFGWKAAMIMFLLLWRLNIAMVSVCAVLAKVMTK